MKHDQAKPYYVKYLALFRVPTIRRFETKERATTWCRQIGRPDLIPTIRKTREIYQDNSRD